MWFMCHIISDVDFLCIQICVWIRGEKFSETKLFMYLYIQIMKILVSLFKNGFESVPQPTILQHLPLAAETRNSRCRCQLQAIEHTARGLVAANFLAAGFPYFSEEILTLCDWNLKFRGKKHFNVSLMWLSFADPASRSVCVCLVIFPKL